MNVARGKELGLVAAFAVVAGCRDPGPKSGLPAASEVARASDAGARAAAPADPVVELLHTVDCTVAVSSKVENPHDFPEHLVDGKLETAWNGRTGDLGGSISFRTPPSSHVLVVELTAGFDRVTPKGDLFTMNHRITKLRVSRAGAVLKEVDLDPSVRGLQKIELDAPGGDFELKVLATQPGSEKKWRELTVSELRVWGRAGGAPENPSHLPRMAIGSLDGVPPHPTQARLTPTPGPFASLEDLCRAWDRAMSGPIDTAFPGDRYPGKIEAPHCKAIKDGDKAEAARTAAVAVLMTKGPFLGGFFVQLHDPDEEKRVLVLKTAAGLSRTNVTLGARSHDDPGCMHGSDHVVEDATLTKTSTGQDVLVVRVVHRDVFWGPYEGRGATTREVAYACRLDDKGAASCEGPVVVGDAQEQIPSGFNPEERASWGFFDADAGAIPWRSRTTPVLGPAGDLRKR